MTDAASDAQEPRKAAAPDWETIEAQFRAGILSVRELARQHGVTDTAIRKRATAGGWQRDLSTKVRAVADSEPRRETPDWETAEAAYRSGILSVRQIARQHKLNEATLRKRAATHGWQRDLGAKVRAETETRLVRSLAEPPPSDRQTDRQIVEDAAAVQVAVVREHRAQLARARQVFAALMAELEEATSNVEEIEDQIALETAGDDNNRRRDQMIRAVSLPSRSGVMLNLSSALDRLVKLDRQAFAIDAKPAESNEQATKAWQDAAELRARWEEMTALEKARAYAFYIEERMRAVKAEAAQQETEAA